MCKPSQTLSDAVLWALQIDVKTDNCYKCGSDRVF